MSRPGLYLLVFFCLLNSCSASHEASEDNLALKKIADAVAAPKQN
jgi:hypothetical protein